MCIRDSALTAQRQLYYIQAIDAPEQTDREWTPEEIFSLLKHPSLTETGKLMGVVPLYVGMHVRLTQLIKAPFLVQNVPGVVKEIHFHPAERVPDKEDPDKPIRLKYMPLGVIVQLDENPFSAPVLVRENVDPADAGVVMDEALASKRTTDLPPGLIFIKPQESTWKFQKRTAGIIIPGTEKKVSGPTFTIRIKRRQLPFMPVGIDTHYGHQGQTARQGFFACLEPTAQMVRHDPRDVYPGDYWLSVYVLLSRPTSIFDLLISGLPDRSIFSQGPPLELSLIHI